MGSRPLRVFLVEDSKELAFQLTEIVQQIPTMVLIGSATTEVAAIAQIARARVDVLLLDINLSQGSGFGVLRALTNMGFKGRIIVLTNNDLPEYERAAMDLGATQFLDKARDYLRLPSILRQIGDSDAPPG